MKSIIEDEELELEDLIDHDLEEEEEEGHTNNPLPQTEIDELLPTQFHSPDNPRLLSSNSDVLIDPLLIPSSTPKSKKRTINHLFSAKSTQRSDDVGTLMDIEDLVEEDAMDLDDIMYIPQNDGASDCEPKKKKLFDFGSRKTSKKEEKVVEIKSYFTESIQTLWSPTENNDISYDKPDVKSPTDTVVFDDMVCDYGDAQKLGLTFYFL